MREDGGALSEAVVEEFAGGCAAAAALIGRGKLKLEPYTPGGRERERHMSRNITYATTQTLRAIAQSFAIRVYKESKSSSEWYKTPGSIA